MIVKEKKNRQIPGIISYMEVFSSRKLAYSIFFFTPIVLGLISLMLNYILLKSKLDLFHFFRFVFLFLSASVLGTLFSMGFYKNKSPILKAPPIGWSIQMNAFFSVIVEITFILGQVVAILVNNITMQEVFLILGSVLSYIVAFVIYFSFTTVGRSGNIILGLVQPFTVIFTYSVYTGQFNIDFFIRAMVVFIVCAIFFAIPYRRGLFKVSNIYEVATGMRG